MIHWRDSLIQSRKKKLSLLKIKIIANTDQLLKYMISNHHEKKEV